MTRRRSKKWVPGPYGRECVWLTPNEAAEHFEITPRRVLQLVDRGIPHKVSGSRHFFPFPVAAIWWRCYRDYLEDGRRVSWLEPEEAIEWEEALKAKQEEEFQLECAQEAAEHARRMKVDPEYRAYHERCDAEEAEWEAKREAAAARKAARRRHARKRKTA